jgi:hypothetical protein
MNKVLRVTQNSSFRTSEDLSKSEADLLYWEQGLEKRVLVSPLKILQIESEYDVIKG